jgi:aspartate/methionine/tyrosine aminotransferase
VRRENGFRIDPDEIKRLADSKTKLILVNSPHNPSRAAYERKVEVSDHLCSHH